MAQVIDHLPCKREAEFKPQNHKKKKKNQRIVRMLFPK
jgi:hypothetical protein